MLRVISKRKYELKNEYRGVGFVSPQQEAWMFIHKPEIAKGMLEFYGHAPGYWEWRARKWNKDKKSDQDKKYQRKRVEES